MSKWIRLVWMKKDPTDQERKWLKTVEELLDAQLDDELKAAEFDFEKMLEKLRR